MLKMLNLGFKRFELSKTLFVSDQRKKKEYNAFYDVVVAFTASTNTQQSSVRNVDFNGQSKASWRVERGLRSV